MTSHPSPRPAARRTRTTARLTLAAVVLFAVVGACSSDDGAQVRELGGSGGTGGSGSSTASHPAEAVCVPVGDPATATETVTVLLDEWRIAVAPTEMAAGPIAFEVTNVGDHAHEMLLMRADSLDDVPLDADGHVDETAIAEADFIGEIKPFPGGGETCTGVFDLEPGTYAAICAIVEEESDGTVEDHHALGMATLVTVT